MGRVGTFSTAWIPSNFQPTDNLRTEYLQVDLGHLKTVTAVSTQGLTRGTFFVKTYSLKFSKDGDIFDDFYHAKSTKVRCFYFDIFLMI